MLDSPLSKHAGPIAITAGGLFAVTHVVQFAFYDPSDLVATVADPGFQLFIAAYAMTFPLLLIALVAFYLRQAEQAGALGAVGFCIALAGTVGLAGDEYFEAFGVPWAIQVAPVLVEVEHGRVLVAAWLVSVVLFALGWALFGLVSFRTQVFPRGLSVGVAVGGLLGFFAAQPPWGVALGSAVAAVGVWLTRSDRVAPGFEATTASDLAPLARTR